MQVTLSNAGIFFTYQGSRQRERERERLRMRRGREETLRFLPLLSARSKCGASPVPEKVREGMGETRREGRTESSAVAERERGGGSKSCACGDEGVSVTFLGTGYILNSHRLGGTRGGDCLKETHAKSILFTRG